MKKSKKFIKQPDTLVLVILLCLLFLPLGLIVRICSKKFRLHDTYRKFIIKYDQYNIDEIAKKLKKQREVVIDDLNYLMQNNIIVGLKLDSECIRLVEIV